MDFSKVSEVQKAQFQSNYDEFYSKPEKCAQAMKILHQATKLAPENQNDALKNAYTGKAAASPLVTKAIATIKAGTGELPDQENEALMNDCYSKYVVPMSKFALFHAKHICGDAGLKTSVDAKIKLQVVVNKVIAVAKQILLDCENNFNKFNDNSEVKKEFEKVKNNFHKIAQVCHYCNGTCNVDKITVDEAVNVDAENKLQEMIGSSILIKDQLNHFTNDEEFSYNTSILCEFNESEICNEVSNPSSSFENITEEMLASIEKVYDVSEIDIDNLSIVDNKNVTNMLENGEDSAIKSNSLVMYTEIYKAFKQIEWLATLDGRQWFIAEGTKNFKAKTVIDKRNDLTIFAGNCINGLQWCCDNVADRGLSGPFVQLMGNVLGLNNSFKIKEGANFVSKILTKEWLMYKGICGVNSSAKQLNGVDPDFMLLIGGSVNNLWRNKNFYYEKQLVETNLTLKDWAKEVNPS